MDNTVNNVTNAAGSNNSNPIIGSDGSQNLFGFNHENPGAKVILNRGSVFENDISEWVMSFSTSNSVDDIVGSFNVVLNNENDRFVDRYNNVKIAEASAIEIFARTSNAGRGQAEANPGTNCDTIIVPESLVGTNATPGTSSQSTVAVDALLTTVINQQYGKVDYASYMNYASQIRDLNPTKVVSTEVASDPKADAMFGDAVIASNLDGSNVNVAWDGTKTISAQDFFANIKGRENSTAFFVTDLSIKKDGFGGFLRNPNGTYQYDEVNIQGIPLGVATSGPFYPVINTSLIRGGNITNTVWRPVVKSQQVPFLKNSDGTPATQVILSPGDILRVPPVNVDYRRIFFGVVINVSQNIAPGGTMTISLSGKSLGYWLEASVINTHPAIEQSQLAGGQGQTTPFANKYADSSALDVFRDLISFSTDDLVAINDYSIDTNAAGVDYLLAAGANQDISVDSQGRVLLDADGQPVKYSSNPIDKDAQLTAKQNALYTGTPFDGMSKLDAKPDPSNSDYTAWQNSAKTYSDAQNAYTSLNNQYNAQLAKVNNDDSTGASPSVKAANRQLLSELEARRNKQSDVMDTAKAEMNSNPTVTAQLDAIQHNLDQNNQQWASQLKAGRNQLFDEDGISKHWQKIFSQLILEVLDSSSSGTRDDIVKKGFLSTVHPFRWEVSAPGWMDGDYQSKADIGRTVAQNIMYEFYFDTNGHFVLKPPLYSISNIADNADYILTDRDIYSININDTLDGIITRIDITGAYYESPSTPREMIYNTYQDFNLIKQYGVQSRQISNLLFIRNNADCRAFGRAFMSRNNVELKNASVTIYGRPEIRLGTSIYLQPRDTVYYIKGISHDFTVGDGITTTLTLVGARRIIRGFRAKKTIKQYYKVLQNDGTFRIATDATLAAVQGLATSGGTFSSTNGLEIEFFVPLNATNFSNLPLNGQATVNAALNAQLNVDNSVGNQESLVDDKVAIITNAYTITNHPNVTLIGLLVSQNSTLLSQINSNYYSFLNSFSSYAANQFAKNYQQLGIADQSQVAPAALIIENAFRVFVGQPESVLSPTDADFLKNYGFTRSSINYGQTAPNAPVNNQLPPEQFNYTMLNFFLVSQYNRIQTQVTGNVAIIDRALYNSLDVQRTLLDLLLKDIDALGSYSQYTDHYGREFPSYVDFGKSMTILQSDLALNNAQNTTSVTVNAAQNNVDAMTTAAIKALGRNPNSPIKTVSPTQNASGINLPLGGPTAAAIQPQPAVTDAVSATPTNAAQTAQNQVAQALSQRKLS